MSACLPNHTREIRLASSVQFLDEDILKLHQGRRAVPFAVAFAAVMLKPDATTRRQARHFGATDDRLAVQHHGYRLPAHGYFITIPFTDRFVRLRAWCHRCAQFRWCITVRPDAVHLARTDRPAPDVHLMFA